MGAGGESLAQGALVTARDRGLEPWGCRLPGERCTKVWQGQGPLGEAGRKEIPTPSVGAKSRSQYTYYTADALANVAQDVAFFAQQEGLTAHARSAVIRMEEA